MSKRILIKFPHGLGDAVQLTQVVATLKHYRPDWSIAVAALKGKHSAFHQLADHVYLLDGACPGAGEFDDVYALAWSECWQTYAEEWPSSKVELCLLDVFGVRPVPELYDYSIAIGEEAAAAAADYLREIAGSPAKIAGRRVFDVVGLHYEGNTVPEMKNLQHDTARRCCEAIEAAGSVPLLLDWDRRSPLPDGRRVFCPDADHPLWKGYGTGDAERIAALISHCRLFIGIDSGPGKVAAATATPTIAVWRKFHPLHYHSIKPTVVHLLPGNHRDLLRGDHVERALDYFGGHYRHRTYGDRLDLAGELVELIGEQLAGRPASISSTVSLPSAPAPAKLLRGPIRWESPGDTIETHALDWRPLKVGMIEQTLLDLESNNGWPMICGGLRWLLRQLFPRCQFVPIEAMRPDVPSWQMARDCDWLVIAGNPRVNSREAGAQYCDSTIWPHILDAVDAGVPLVDAWCGAAAELPLATPAELADRIWGCERHRRTVEEFERRAELVIARDAVFAELAKRAQLDNTVELPCCSWWAPRWYGIEPAGERWADAIMLRRSPGSEWLIDKALRLRERAELPLYLLVSSWTDYCWIRKHAGRDADPLLLADGESLLTFLAGCRRLYSVRVHAAIPAAAVGCEVGMIATDSRALTVAPFGLDWQLMSDLRGEAFRSSRPSSPPETNQVIATLAARWPQPARDRRRKGET